MKIISFGPRRAEQPGVLLGEEIVPLAPALCDAGLAGLPPNALLALWPLLLDSVVRKAIEHGRDRLDSKTVRLGAPVLQPGKVIGVGLNYQGHVGQVVDPKSLPAEPVLFLKPPSAIGGPFDTLVKPIESCDVEPELEIAVVIGKAGHRLTPDRAMEHVLGFMCANDVTARDVFIGESARSALFLQAARGKGFPGFCPTGPWLLTRDDAPELDAFELELSVNGELRQAGRSDALIANIPSLVSVASAAFGLMPGDIVLTGSPPRRRRADGSATSLIAGDELRASITSLGTMVCSVADEASLQ
ncbi:fumarylacetoacetate hydrolase family protein [Aquabacterium sp.]|uniref:fumarylacetoacetate hydrolase family protein n=1 Tax=Aquabacterium sp. TaxID=1872578 RepID=UPI002CE3AD64|nr:fumarylacetoacetate hydrolase family protein [Aquabacterium sp.]HSW05200.1 fumarylacetoacetate hydrolase family protein [Aquabacterium sp.]